MTSLAVAAVVAGCGDDRCGPDGAPEAGLVASGGGATLTYGGLAGGLNNDCPAADAPAGVVSLTIAGTQSDGTGLVTLCIARPDRLASRPLALGSSADAEVRVVDFTGTASGCTFKLDATQPPTGTASASGLCGNGADPAGFALVLDGTLALTRTCATVDSVAVTLRGRVAVAGPP